MTVLEAMARLHTCVKNRESGRPRSLAVGMHQCLFIETEVVELGSRRTKLPYQSRHGSYGVEVCPEAGEHKQNHDEGRCDTVLCCLLQHKD
jgi:hypothetical protein